VLEVTNFFFVVTSPALILMPSAFCP